MAAAWGSSAGWWSGRSVGFIRTVVSGFGMNGAPTFIKHFSPWRALRFVPHSYSVSKVRSSSESEAKRRGIAYRLAKIPLTGIIRSWTLSEPRGFYKALIAADSDRILGFTAFAPEAGEVVATVQLAIAARLPYTALRDAILTHPTMAEGLAALFRAVPARP